MIITRKKKVPLHWLFYAQLPLLLSIYGAAVINAPFLLLIKKFIDNPAAIMGLISIEVYISVFGSPFMAWLSDRIWTRWGRRKFFFVIADVGRAACLLAMPFAPDLITLIILRWLFGLAGDFGTMTQALIYEVVPPPQRGKLSGFFQASIQVGNIVFYFLLLGRFDDYYFMGPFIYLTELSGGAIMFWLAAIILLGIAVYEGLGFREIKPPDFKTINDGRKPGRSLFVHFLKSFYQDVFAKDLLPLYLFMVVNIMFGVNLGIFQPLLFTEQWGYSLQDMGNTIAVGAIFSVTFALASGWFADRFGKMQTFVLATAGSMGMNIFYTIFVYFQPDHRPSLTQIVVIGNITAAFGMVKAVVSFPLMMEYVKRSRMGSANAGAQIFQTLVRNAILLFVGVWLVWWSFWFLPQAGYHVTTTFPTEIDETQLRSEIKTAGLNPDDFILQPIHQYGVDGETSMRWWIHRDDKFTHELLSELKDVKNELASMEAEVLSPFISDENREKLSHQIDLTKGRVTAINEELAGGVESLRSALLPALETHLYTPGAQLREVSLLDHTLSLTVTTIEALPEDQISLLEQNLAGPQYAVVPNDAPKAASRWRSDVEIRPITEGGPGIAIKIDFDPSFLAIYRHAFATTANSETSFELATIITSVLQGELGRGRQQFRIEDTSYHLEGENQSLQFTLLIAANALNKDASALAQALTQEKAISEARTEDLGQAKHRFTLQINNLGTLDPNRDALNAARVAEVRNRLTTLLPDTPLAYGLVIETYLRLTDVLSSSPFYITIPEHTPRSNYREREYEYFFASKTLEIATDIFGFGVILFILYMEKRGVIHRSGAEEDLNR